LDNRGAVFAAFVKRTIGAQTSLQKCDPVAQAYIYLAPHHFVPWPFGELTQFTARTAALAHSFMNRTAKRGGTGAN
jgi:hypothetical protein